MGEPRWDPDRLARELRTARIFGKKHAEVPIASTLDLVEEAARLRAEVAARDADLADLREQMDRMVPDDWHGLMTILDRHYGESVFPTLPDGEDRDPGPRIVSLLRTVAGYKRLVRGLTYIRPTPGQVSRDGNTWDPVVGWRPLAGVDPALAALLAAASDEGEARTDGK